MTWLLLKAGLMHVVWALQGAGGSKAPRGSEASQTGMGRRQRVSNPKVSPSSLSVPGAIAVAHEKTQQRMEESESHHWQSRESRDGTCIV